ncbi:MAG: hypothetical protein M3Y07_08345 [Acidobacteriota bacterium]|nr:hypothetical protein [Acidobacteriota bacterium]
MNPEAIPPFANEQDEAASLDTHPEALTARFRTAGQQAMICISNEDA